MRPGLFVSVDGPGGVGKSTTLATVTEILRDQKVPIHATTEPSRSPIGNLIRASTNSHRGLALAHLVAGDRHHHVTTEIIPRLDAGDVVVSDRYIPSSLVLQRFDAITIPTILEINAGLLQPDLAVILTADPTAIAARMAARGGVTNSRFERHPDAACLETSYYQDAVAALTEVGWPVSVLDSTTLSGAEVGRMLAEQILTLYAQRRNGDLSDQAGIADLQHR